MDPVYLGSATTTVKRFQPCPFIAIVYGYLHETIAEVDSWDRNWKKVSHLWCACSTFSSEGPLSLEESLCEAWIQDTSLPSLGFSGKMCLYDVWIVHDDDNKTWDCLPPILWGRAEERSQVREKALGLGSHVGLPQSLCLLWRSFQHYCFCLLKPNPHGAHHPWQWAQTCPGPSLPVLAKSTGGGGSTGQAPFQEPCLLTA